MSGPPDLRKIRPSTLFTFPAMPTDDSPLTLANRLLVADAFLEEIERGKVGGTRKPRLQSIAIAHGLAYNPHVDDRLRLTPVGRARLDDAA